MKTRKAARFGKGQAVAFSLGLAGMVRGVVVRARLVTARCGSWYEYTVRLESARHGRAWVVREGALRAC